MKRKFSLLLSLLLVGSTVLCAPAITGKASEGIQVQPQALGTAAPTEADLTALIRNASTTEITLTSGKTYNVTGIMELHSNLTIDLNGATITRTDAGSIFMTPGTDTGGYDAYKNIIIKNGTIKGSGASSAGLVIIGHATNVKFENVTFTGAKDGHMLEFAACKDVEVTGCKFADGNYSSSEDKGEYEAFTLDVAKQGNFEVAPYDNFSCENVTISKCTFTNVRRALGAHRIIRDHLFKNINITGCTFSNITGTALEAVGFVDSKIDGNTFSNVGFGIDCKPSSKNIISSPGSYDANITISNNTIALQKSTSKTTCGVRINGIESTNLGKFTVSNLKVEGPHTYAVYAGNVTNSTIEGVTSSNAASNGVRVEKCDGVKVSGSTISKTKSHGIALINSKNDTVEGNTINNAKGHGIALEASTNETITGNTISKPKKSGINLYKKSTCALVSENKIVKPKTCGINCQDKKSKVYVTCANVVKKPGVRSVGGDGVYFAAKEPVVKLKKGKGASAETFGKSGKAKYSSANKSVATVDSSGKIKAKGKGTTIITAKKGKFKAQIKVTVK